MSVFARKAEKLALRKMLTLPALETSKDNYYKTYFDNEDYVKYFDEDLCGIFDGKKPMAYRQANMYYRIHHYEKVEVVSCKRD